ncbi:MAG: FeoB-associated Cys-rich membrane protein [Ruminococcaceae bacterium]|nr:FeoB-associated Cys-rich membrane protein [Oscillospiraceae bacterium]
MLVNIIATILVVAALGGAIAYVIRAKKKGAKCIGCPHSSSCPSAKGGASSCGCGCGESRGKQN